MKEIAIEYEMFRNLQTYSVKEVDMTFTDWQDLHDEYISELSETKPLQLTAKDILIPDWEII